MVLSSGRSHRWLVDGAVSEYCVENVAASSRESSRVLGCGVCLALVSGRSTTLRLGL